jgi:hypothetical protein
MPALLLLLVCAVLLSAGLLTRMYRRRGLSWLNAHVTVAARSGPSAIYEAHPTDELNRDHVLSVVPVEVLRTTILEENPL